MSLENINIEKLENLSGGRFQLVTLFQKRLRELQRGLPPLVDIDTDVLDDVVVEEIMQGKIWLVKGEEAKALYLEREEEMKSIAQQQRDAARLAARLEEAAGDVSPLSTGS